MVTQFLKDHNNPGTAYLVDDYPYGYRLRCSIRYWLEHHPRKGSRFISQTLNPKTSVWNKPKASTYCYIGMCMFLNEEGYVKHAGLTEYSTYEQAKSFFDTYGPGLDEQPLKRAQVWMEKKQSYELTKVPIPVRHFERSTRNKLVCQYCGAVKEEISFTIGASKEPTWVMNDGTGKISCPDCWQKGRDEGDAKIEAHIAIINAEDKKEVDAENCDRKIGREEVE